MAAITDHAINVIAAYEATERGDLSVMFCRGLRKQDCRPAELKRTRIALIAFFCILPELGTASDQVGPNTADKTFEPRASIWDAGVLEDSIQGDLQTTAGGSLQDPILVPLPAPILAAGTGLGLAWILRKRMTRV